MSEAACSVSWVGMGEDRCPQQSSLPPHVTLNLMPRRAQLALALVLLLVLAPLAGATCGIQCLAATPHTTHAAIAHHECKRALTCCPSSAPAICSPTQAPDSSAVLLSAETSAPGAPALATIAATSVPIARILATRKIESTRAGQPLAASPTPLRV